MTSENLTELALRAAVNNTNRDLSSGTNQPQEIKSSALKRAQELLTGSSTGSSGGQLNAQAIAIGLAVQGLELSFFAVKSQLENVKNRRLAFDKERQAGLATFIVPTNVEERDLSIQERVISKFMELSTKNPSFSMYLGIHKATLKENKDAIFYSTFPFYRMSDALGQPLSSSRSVDRQRTTINLFFKSALPEAIADIETVFQTNYKFIEFFRSAYDKENYLNDLRSPRFIMMSLANLLWNLQHPVDPGTGFPLGLDSCIQLCRDAEAFLNKILNNEENASLQEISTDKNQLLSFVRKIEIHIKGLRAAYTEEQLYELNFNDLTNSAHRTLRIMDKSVLELIYSYHNPITEKDEPDGKAADDLAYSISYLNQLINYNPELIKPFETLAPNLKGIPYLNNPPVTVIDALITFIHSSTNKKELLFKKIGDSKNDSALEFIAALKALYTKFIRPIKKVSKQELGVSTTDRQHEKVAELTARRLLPLITLVVEDYRVDVEIKQKNPLQTDTKDTTKKYRAKEQVKAINSLAEMDKYYVWALSPFIELETDTEEELDKLPKHQYRFTKITQLLDSVSEIVQNYRSFLQLKSFQEFLIKCLNKIKEEYTILEQHIVEVDKCLASDKAMTRNMESILRPMTGDLNSSLNDFSLATKNFEHIVTAPDFTEKQKQLLSSALESINQQYSDLFKEDHGFSYLANDNNPPEILKEKINPTAINSLPKNIIETVATEEAIDKKQIIALRKLVTQCFDALSYQSKYSAKGRLLNNLLNLIDTTPKFTASKLSQVVKELAKVTLSYRKTCFFQAAYGETRSAKSLISAIKDPDLNAVLPLTFLMFGSNTDLSKESETQITVRLKSLRETNQWQESAEQIQNALVL